MAKMSAAQLRDSLLSSGVIVSREGRVQRPVKQPIHLSRINAMLMRRSMFKAG